MERSTLKALRVQEVVNTDDGSEQDDEAVLARDEPVNEVVEGNLVKSRGGTDDAR